MAEVQYAPMSYDKFYSLRKHNSETSFDHLTFPNRRDSFEHRPSPAPSSFTDSPRNSSTSISTVSSCGSYFESVDKPSSLDTYEVEETFSFPSYDGFKNNDKPTFIHL